MLESAYGPDQKCARLEGSKAFTKDFSPAQNSNQEYANFSEIILLNTCSPALSGGGESKWIGSRKRCDYLPE